MTARSARSPATTPRPRDSSHDSPPQRGHAPTTVDALVTVRLTHLQHPGRSRPTLRRYEQLWRTWLEPSLGDIAPNDLRGADIEHALDHMHKAGQSERSIHRAAVVLNATLAWAREQLIVETNPATGCELPPTEQS